MATVRESGDGEGFAHEQVENGSASAYRGAPTNGLGPRRAILYARVSTDEQARSGYSLAQQMEALREYAAREGYEVLEEVRDPGQSGASLERPGMDRVRDLVAAGGVSVVLAQDRDRFAREPAYHYLMRREFEEHGTKIRALNDRGDESPEGELTDGILDQLAKYERAKTAERSRRGKLRKAREGKIVATTHVNFGFKYTQSRDAYAVREDHMSTVRRVFRMVALEGASLYKVKKTLEREGLLPPKGGSYWNKKTLREMILDDVYKPHAPEEIGSIVAEGAMSPEVAASLDPSRSYGVWWYNRRRYVRTRRKRPDGSYYWKKNVQARPRRDWIAVPVPDSGVPREHVDAAREAIKDNRRREPAAKYRYWELAGIFVCGVCGCRMSKTRRVKGHGYEGYYHYYFCPTRTNKGQDACPQQRGFRAEPLEAEVWELVRCVMLDPKLMLDDINRMVEEERNTVRGDPQREAAVWLDQIAAVERKRSGFQDMAAEGLITLDELRCKLAELDDLRATAESELRAIESRKDTLRQLESDRDALLEHYVTMAPEALDALSPEERHRLYQILRLRVTADADRILTAEGMFGGFSVQEENSTCVTPLRWKAASNSSGMRERSPRTMPRTTAASVGLRPWPSAASVRRWTRPIQPRSSPTGYTPVASTTALILFVERYESQTTKPLEVAFSAVLAENGARKVRLERVTIGG
jgi:site-specific DNA recombinase